MSDKKAEKKDVVMVRVIATKQGYDNVKLREPNDEFMMPEDAKGSWFEPVEEAEKSAPKAKTDQKPDPKAKDDKKDEPLV